MRTIRIGGGAGYGGDRIEPALELIRYGNLDYIIFECLAERTIALAQQRKLADPEQGYNEFLEYRFENILPLLKEQIEAGKSPVKIITNMGAANPHSALHALRVLACEAGLPQLRIAAVLGDDVYDRVIGRRTDTGEAIAAYDELTVLETGEPLKTLKDKIVSANAYIGAEGIIKALEQGADIVITGRVADPALVLGPLVYEFGWAMDDWDKLGKGTAAGHLLECGAQVCGGYFADPGYKNVPEVWNQGFPIAEVAEDGTITITKLEQAGGCVTEDTVAEQLIYEIHDPARYLTPDVTADFSNIFLETEEKDRVIVKGASGSRKNGFYKVSVGYRDGFIGEGEISYGGAGCVKRAELAAKIVRHRLKPWEDRIGELRIDLIGVNSLYGSGNIGENNGSEVFVQNPEPAEVRLRVAVRSEDRRVAAVVGEEVETLYTNGPAGGGGARKYVRSVMSVASVFIPQSDVEIRVMISDAAAEQNCGKEA